MEQAGTANDEPMTLVDQLNYIFLVLTMQLRNMGKRSDTDKPGGNVYQIMVGIKGAPLGILVSWYMAQCPQLLLCEYLTNSARCNDVTCIWIAE